ncbi:hypothetical protein [Vibrio splendidus]|uniref:hypothetical protein n=1 Tax=Vibrio splendidus TaxID=29497 RepID=UPI000D3890D9|nr:hypothetical protein [Vibrio splendidus]PTP27535.1 hypothetical protein CWN95_23600 [Vibrio splendidus]
MKTKIMNQSEHDALLISTFNKNAKRGNQNWKVRVNELRQAAARIEAKHSKIIKLEKICDDVQASLEAVKTRNSFGYKEVTELLQEVINFVRSNN